MSLRGSHGLQITTEGSRSQGNGQQADTQEPWLAVTQRLCVMHMKRLVWAEPWEKQAHHTDPVVLGQPL